MENTIWRYIKPLKNEDGIVSFLKKYSVELPQALICFLERNNGGRPQDNIFTTDTGREYVFKCLLSYNTDDTETIYKVYPGPFRAENLFPLGSDASGNFVCYDCINKQYVLANHETGACEKIIVVN